MNSKSCQCTPSRSGPGVKCPTSVRVYELSHKRAQLPAILRYRGLKDEAQAASWMLEIETNLAAVRNAVSRLDTSMAGLVANFSDLAPVKRQGPVKEYRDA